MATTKITLNELRSIVKQIIKEERMLNEDNLEVKNIAKQLYSFLKKNGVREVSLDTSKLNIGKDSANDAQGNQIGNRDNTAKIAYFDDPKTKQTIIEVYLFGDSNKIQEIEKMLLNSFPGLGQINRELNKNSNSPKDKVYYLHFTVAEKTTAKGGLVGNLNELRSIVKQIIKEEMVLKEALNKDIKEFGRDLGKYLTNAGFKVKYVNGRISDENRTYLNTNTGLVAFETDQNQDQQSLYLYFNPKEKSKIENIVNKFQLTPYSGKPMNAGWTRKQVVGALNPGDIFKVDGGQGMYQFFRLAKVNTQVKDV